MAIHSDDPAWSVFGLPRIISSQENLKRLIEMVPNKHNGVTFCMGSYGLYDRSLGAAYLCGLQEVIEKEAKKKAEVKTPVITE